MRIIIGLSLFGFVLIGTPTPAADLGGHPLGGNPEPTSIRFSVPYSFSNVHRDLTHAVIRCVAQIAPNTPPIAAGQTTVIVNGQPKSGTAVIVVTPVPGQRLSNAKHYSCGMQVSNGKITMTPQFGAAPAWAKTHAGSTLMVSGQIK
jgi:hypothetical protein